MSIMQKSKKTLIEVFETLIEGNYENWQIGRISLQQYLVAKHHDTLPYPHHFFETTTDDANGLVRYFNDKGVTIHKIDKINLPGVVFIPPNASYENEVL
ncbi:hypothetical protein D4L85_21220 [Chryseolinea soli]|uniref:Uncharacterized protein n=1 Tax=Chryseolinea soli TaxID=2321403 RepID=A0A385SME5_9BACT|nr:hypothetical protein D4L85_21220 [Chryseolinea soli]